MKKTIKIGTRASRLALRQAEEVKTRLEANWPEQEFSLVTIKTEGDKKQDTPIAEMGGKAVFTKELERALFAREIDLAVHSLKDMAVRLPWGAEIGAVLERGPAGDAWVGKNGRPFSEIREGATVATGSLRRKALLLHHRPDLEIVGLRGNIETRLEKLEQHDWAGIIMAEAALVRLGLESWMTEKLDRDWMIPSPGQGAIAVEIRAGEEDTRRLVGPLADPDTTVQVLAERKFLERLGGNCRLPAGACALIKEDSLVLTGFMADEAGTVFLKDSVEGFLDEAELLGFRLAGDLLERGGREIIRNLVHE
jgi:hydroxymethylbilane synthase